MPVEFIGYRYLYDALGCDLKGQEEFGVGFAVGEDQLTEVYLGPRPRFGLCFDKSNDRFFVPGKKAMLGDINWARDPSELEYPNTFFCEVSCLTKVEVSQELSEAFHSKDEEAHSTLLAMADEKTAELKTTIELIAGVIGLRFHRQLVLELINEDPVALRLDEEDDFAQSYYGRVLRSLKGSILRKTG